jgi:hypothetical protein
MLNERYRSIVVKDADALCPIAPQAPPIAVQGLSLEAQDVEQMLNTNGRNSSSFKHMPIARCFSVRFILPS